MKMYVLAIAVVLFVQGAAASGCGCNSCPFPVPVPTPVPVAPKPVPKVRQCPPDRVATWKRPEAGGFIVPWSPYQDPASAQKPSAFIQQTSINCGTFQQVGGKCDILCQDVNNPNEWTVSPYGALTESGWGWGESEGRLGTYCAGYVKPLPLDPTDFGTPLPFSGVRCMVVPSALCCYPKGIIAPPVDPENPIWIPPPPPLERRIAAESEGGASGSKAAATVASAANKTADFYKT